MGKKPKKRTAEFKFRVVLESIQKGNVAEVARRYGVNPNQLSLWRKQFFETGSKIFEESPGKAVEKYRKKIEQLEVLIGKKEVEISVLKNFLDFYVPPDGE